VKLAFTGGTQRHVPYRPELSGQGWELINRTLHKWRKTRGLNEKPVWIVNMAMHFPSVEDWPNRSVRTRPERKSLFWAGFVGKNDKDLFDEALAVRYKPAKRLVFFGVGSPSRANS
jgi:hypothetical protein